MSRLDKKGAIMTVYGDKLLLTSLFANLISNSIKLQAAECSTKRVIFYG